MSTEMNRDRAPVRRPRYYRAPVTREEIIAEIRADRPWWMPAFLPWRWIPDPPRLRRRRSR